MPRIKLRLAYVGTNFSGWQLQAGPLRTVQGELEAALARILGQEARVHGSGRTDAGVHADEQVAHFDVPPGRERINWRRALNGKLPPDISVLSAETAADDFHARFDCRGKTYTYTLWLDPTHIPPKLRDFVWALGASGLVGGQQPGSARGALVPLNFAAMDEAASKMLGRHDFAAFQNFGSPPGDTWRELFSITRHYLPLPGRAWAPGPGPLLAWRFTGDGFLKQMVRNLTGFLVYVGLGRLAPADLEPFLAGGRRCALDFPTAPARGLTLSEVFY